MKNLVMGTLCILCVSISAQSKSLPSLGNVNIEIHTGPSVAAVQPTTYLNFTFVSCRERDFVVTTRKSRSGTVKISVADNSGSDCESKDTEKPYSLQISSDATSEKYILLNPLAPKYR